VLAGQRSPAGVRVVGAEDVVPFVHEQMVQLFLIHREVGFRPRVRIADRHGRPVLHEEAADLIRHALLGQEQQTVGDVLRNCFHRSARLLPATTLAAVLLAPAALGFAFHCATSAYEDQPHCRSPATGIRQSRPATHQSSPTPAVRRSSATTSSPHPAPDRRTPRPPSGGSGRGQGRNGGCTGRRAHGTRNPGSARPTDLHCGSGMLRGRGAACRGRADPEGGRVDHIRRSAHPQTGLRGQLLALEDLRHVRLGVATERPIDAGLDVLLEEVAAAGALDPSQHPDVQRGLTGDNRRSCPGIVGNRDGRDAHRMAQLRPEIQLHLRGKPTMRPARVQC
jgi:hypothetical protein